MLTRFPAGIYASPIVGSGLVDMFAGTSWDNKTAGGNIFFVDGDNGDDTWDGHSPDSPMKTIAAAIAAAARGAVIYIKARSMATGATDPVSYAEALTIPAAKDGMSLIGVASERAQGRQPQIKKGSGTAALLTVRAPGCLIYGITFNGAGSTGGGISLDDDGSTKTAFGTVILNCFFKNCVGTTATDARTGGAIQWSATNGGAAWQVLISGNRFYKNVGDVVLMGNSVVPQDVVIEDNIFSGPAANTDCNLYLGAGSGMNGVIIRNNVFTAFPDIGSGSVLLFADLTGCVGVLANNQFAGNGYTFKAAGTGAKVPATVFMAGNSQEITASGGASGGQFSRAS